MGKLVRCITADGSAIACAIDSTDIVNELQKIHQSMPVITAALGRLATASSIMGHMLKGENDTVTLRLNGGGPAGTLIAVSNSMGNVKAYVDHPDVELPLNSMGKLDVKGAVGTDGSLSVIRDMGLKEPYIGQTPIVSGEIAEDITSYYAVSEQIPTVCGLGVLVDTDLTVKAAGGYLVQLLPFADEHCIDKIEENMKSILPVSTMIDRKMTPEEICNLLLHGLEPNVLEEISPAYHCDCSRERVERTLLSLHQNELEEMRDEDHGCEVCCHFCEKKYRFTEAELQKLIDRKSAAASENPAEN